VKDKLAIRIDPYEIMGLDKKATAKEIKSRFRKLVNKYHPDKPNGDSSKYIQVVEAYRILGNKKLRKQFDKTGTVEQEIDNTYQEAVQAIVTMFMGMVQSDDEDDIKTQMQESIESKIEDVESGKEDLEEKVKAMNQIIPKISQNGKGVESEYFVNAIKDRIQDLNVDIEKANEAIKIMNKMKEIVSKINYEFKEEEKEDEEGIMRYVTMNQLFRQQSTGGF
jgi:DnaJ-class molecular chaperone